MSLLETARPAPRPPGPGQAGGAASARAGGLFVVTLLALSAFGPYVAGAVRTDQLAVYGAGLLVLPLLRFGRAGGTHVPLLWLALVLLGTLGWLHPPTRPLGTYLPGSAVANLDNLLGPLVLMLVMASVVTAGNRERVLRRVAALTVGAMCLNALVTLAELALPLQGLLAHWWAPDGNSVASLALTNSRFTGIVNQPAEAGALYAVAMMCALYLMADRPGRLTLTLALLAVGGALTVSKVFFLGAAVVAWHLVRLGSGRARRLVWAVSAGLVVWAAYVAGLLPAWAGAAQLRHVLPEGDSSFLSTLTAGRYGAGSTIRPVLDNLFHDQPFIGYGFPGLDVPYDSVWVETLVLTGVVGTLVAAGVFASLWQAHRRCRGVVAEPERRLFAGLLVILAGSSTGLPVLTANRVSVLVWMLLVPLAAAAVPRLPSPRSVPRLPRQARRTARRPAFRPASRAALPPPPRASRQPAAPSGARRRAAGALADQAVSSLTNFVVLFAALHLLDVQGLGAFTLAYILATMVVVVVRALVLDALLVRYAGVDEMARRRATRRAAGTSAMIGTVLALAAVALYAVLPGRAGGVVLVAGLAMPGVLVQDVWRHHLFAAGRYWAAAGNDAVCLAATLVALPALAAVLPVTVPMLVAAWGLGALAGAHVGVLQTGVLPGLVAPLVWLRENGDMGLPLAAAAALQQGAGRLALVLVGALGGVKALGLISASLTLMTPVNTLITAAVSFAVPEAAARRRRGAEPGGFLACVSGSLLAAVAALVVLYLAAPGPLGGLVGENWSDATVLLIPVALWVAGSAGSEGARIGLIAGQRTTTVSWLAAVLGTVLVAAAAGGAYCGGAAGAAWSIGLVSALGAAAWWAVYARAVDPIAARTAAATPAMSAAS